MCVASWREEASDVTITEFPIEGLKGPRGTRTGVVCAGDNYRIPD